MSDTTTQNSRATTLAHISDLHLPPVGLFSTWHWNLKRIFGLVNWYRNRRHLYLDSAAAALAEDIVAMAPDHIAVTGDLANFGLPGEFQKGLAWLDTLGPLDRVSLIPGNHDIYTVRCDVTCLRAWDHAMQSDAWGRQEFGDPDGFPYVRRVGPLAIVALNSAIPTNLFIASGRIGERQMKALAETLDKLQPTGLARVVLIHHPPLPSQAPPRRALVDGAEFARVLEQHGAELVLHGHNHRDSIVWTGRAPRQIPIVGAAAGAVGQVHPHEPLARYNIYEFHGEPRDLKIDVVTRGLDRPGGKVVELKRTRLTPDVAVASSKSGSQSEI